MLTKSFDLHSIDIPPDPAQLKQAIATIIAIEKGQLRVRIETHTLMANRAVSCLVEPEVGDRVAVVGNAPDELYVIAILERIKPCTTRISAGGDLCLETPSGHLNIAATEGVTVSSPQRISVSADAIDAHANEGNVFVSHVKIVAHSVSSVIESVIQKAKNVVRHVVEMESVQAGQINYESDGNLRIHGDNTIVTARTVVKADASQVHIG